MYLRLSVGLVLAKKVCRVSQLYEVWAPGWILLSGAIYS